MASTVSLKEEIKARAHRLGFSLAGISGTEPLVWHAAYVEWLRGGNHAGMRYLASDRHIENRKDPHTLMPTVQSILVLGLPYELHPISRLDAPHIGLVAGYAAGEDYHTRIPRLLSPLVESLDELFGCRVQTRIFSDSAPILERELGVQSGLGWIGRNSCLISPRAGSAFLLAEVFLDQPLEPDPPFTGDRCGNCQRCVQACPTGCILPNRTIDARRCLSYHTIENRAQVPVEIAAKLGSWVFGCDICQMVCPWNHRRSNNVSIAQEPIALTEGEMRAILQMNELEFKSAFGNSALTRAKATGLQRNIALRMQVNSDSV